MQEGGPHDAGMGTLSLMLGRIGSMFHRPVPLTLITCSYNTPEVLKAMLQSYVQRHGDGPHAVIISENSTDEKTAMMLRNQGIAHIRAAGRTHAESMDALFALCQTRFALVVDSDVIFMKSIHPLCHRMRQLRSVLLGEVGGDRGGYSLHRRVHPWFMIVDVMTIRRHGIIFHDRVRVEATGSQGFFQNIPVQPNAGATYYDVGATFLEDIMKARLPVYDCRADPEYFRHYEGMSWRSESGDPDLVRLAQETRQRWESDLERNGTNQVDIRGKFVGLAP